MTNRKYSTNVPVKLECGCGAKMEFVVGTYDVAEAWFESFWERHQECVDRSDLLAQKEGSDE